MTWSLIVIAIGIIMIVADWHMATKPDEGDKKQKRKPLGAVKAKMIRDMVLWTVVLAIVAYFLPGWFSD